MFLGKRISWMLVIFYFWMLQKKTEGWWQLQFVFVNLLNCSPFPWEMIQILDIFQLGENPALFIQCRQPPVFGPLIPPQTP